MAVVFIVSVKLLIILWRLNLPFPTKKRNEPNAPMAPASLAVNTPKIMPPIIPIKRTSIPQVLFKEYILSFQLALAPAGANSGLRLAIK